VDQVQWRYELIRPLVLFEEHPTRPAILGRVRQPCG
jgi:hypothetical protein